THSKFTLARWVTANDANELKRFMNHNDYRMAMDVVNAPAILASHNTELNLIQEKWPDIQFHAMREHGGQVFTEALAD
ncbi:MAG: peptide chain release factor 3, partial [Burkholderiaceae bacterium]